MFRILGVSISDDFISSEAIRLQMEEVDPVIEIKAVTHHELEIGALESENGSNSGFWAKVILDV